MENLKPDLYKIRQYVEAHIEQSWAKELLEFMNTDRKPKMGPIPAYGDHMSMQEFIDHCEHGGFNDYDGYATLATATENSDVHIVPSDITDIEPVWLHSGEEKTIDKIKKWSHVVWYNK